MQRSTKILIVSGVMAVAGLAAWSWTAPETVATISLNTASLRKANNKQAEQGPALSPPAGPEAEPVRRVALLPTGSEMSATQSLLDTRDGDPRSPPVVHSIAPAILASPDELANPKAYQQYEARQNMRLYSSFIDAAQAEVPRLQADVARARAVGIAPAEISKVEQKILRIAALQAQLIRDHPQLATPLSPEK